MTDKISFSDLKLGVFPPTIKVDDLKNFNIKDENIVSFKKVSVEVPFLSLFSKIKKVNLNIHNPVILLNEKILEPGKTAAKSPFEIDRINIIDGELIFTGSRAIVNVLNFNLDSFTRSGRAMYRVRSPHLKVIFPIGKRIDLLSIPDLENVDEKMKVRIIKIEGDMICEFRRQPTSWKISRFLWNTADFRVDVNGRVFKNGTISLNASLHGTPEKILYPILRNLNIQGYMEGSAKIKRRKKETLFIEGDVRYNTFSVGKEEFNNLRGTVKWDSRDKQVRIDALFNDFLLETYLKVYSRPSVTRFEAGNISSERITKVIKINGPVPLGSIIKQSDIKIERGIISGTVTLEQQPGPTEPPGLESPGDTLFNLGGQVTFRYNSKKKAVTFSAADVKAEFGTAPLLEGEVDPTKRTNLRLKVRGNITDIGKLNKYTDYYINLDLEPWKLEKGRGTLTLDLEKINKKFFVESDLKIDNFFSVNQPIDSLTGHISTKNSLTSATLHFLDSKLKGRAELFVGKDYYTIDFKDIEGESQKILKILEVDLFLSGWMRGNFHLKKTGSDDTPVVTGRFRADRINFYDYIFDDVNGDLEYRGHTQIKNLTARYNDGKGKADFFVDYENELYDLEGEIKGININRLNPEFYGRGDIAFKGSGVFDHNPITLEYNSGDIHFYEDRAFNVKGTGKIFTNFSDFRLEARGDLLNEISTSPFTFRLNRKGDDYTGSFRLTLTDINLLIPWGNNDGSMELDGQIFGSADGELSTEGRAVFKGRVVSFPNFPHALENFEGDVIFKDLNFTLRSLQGTMGGGAVESSGYLNIEKNRVQDLFVNIVGKGMNLYVIDRTNLVMDADLNLKYLEGKLLLSGHLHALSGLWKRELDEGISFSTDPSLSPSGSRVMNMLEYDLKLTGRENMRVENSFGNVTGKFDLRLTGNKDFPILMGFIECRQGYINFSDKKFDLIKAKLVFNNKFIIDPLVNVESESFIKDYRIKFNIKGTTSRLQPELQSTPPLPPRDILTLISLGELFERPTSTQLSSQIGTGTTGLIASGLTEQIKKRTKKIFGNYMLKIDPNISNIAGASFEESSRLIVGKEITKDFLVVYATNFSDKREQVIYLQYQLSPSISLIGMRNEERRFSLDLRVRKRR